jgi:tetratricopeptide (TPR) repeat protein
MLNESDEGHLSPLALARLVSGQMDAEEIRRVVVPHLLSRCPGCGQGAAAMREAMREVGHWDAVTSVVEGAEAPQLWQRLAALGHRGQIEAVEGDAEFQTWGLCRLLLRHSAEAVAQRPETAARLAGLAVRVAAHLGEAYDRDWVCDLRALAFAYLGDARRELGELGGARDAVESGRTARVSGTGAPAIEAEALALEALLLRDERRLGEAAALLERAYALCTGAAGGEGERGDPEAVDAHLAGRALAHRAWCVYHLGRHDTARALLAEASVLVDPAREPGLKLAILHGEIWCAITLAQFEEAEALVDPADQVAVAAGVEGDRLRLRRAWARAELGLGEHGPAEATLREMLHRCVEGNLGIDGALALLDLASLYLGQGNAEAVAQLADEVFCLVSCGNVAREEMAELLLVQQACEQRKLTCELVRELAQLIERRRRPSLAWWSGWGTVLGEEVPADAAALAS